MHDIGLLFDIPYADILQLIWPIIDTGTDIYIYMLSLTHNCRDHHVSSVVEFTYSIIIQTLTVLPRQQMQASYAKLKMI